MARLNFPPRRSMMERVEPFQGINTSVTPTQINDHESPDMLNMNIDERGALNKRTGYEKVYDLGTGPINGMFVYKGQHLMAHGTKLYSDSVEVYTGLSDAPVTFFTFKGDCYILDGTNYFTYDGGAVSEVEPYIPTLTISNNPTGGGTSFEDWNLLGSGFKETFSGDDTAVEYQLSLKDLDTDTVLVQVDEEDFTEGTEFTVDRVNGKVTFTTAPPKGTNNVEITAFKTQPDFPERIKNCTMYTVFGGANDTRVFVSGNPSLDNQVWRSGLNDPSYFPENGFYPYEEEVMGFSKQYDYLVVDLKNRKRQISYELNNGVASFPSRPINDQIGTYAKKSIQLIENTPVSLSRDGVFVLTASNVRDERNVQHISANIDSLLLAEPNLDNAISIDYDRKYWLAVNGSVYLYDYAIRQWYIYDNIHASCFLEKDGFLFFGSSTSGKVYRFRKENEPKPFNDDGVSINAYWKSKYFTFGVDEMRKLVEKVFFSLKPDTRTSADLYYITNKKKSDLVESARMDTFDFADMDFTHFSFLTSAFPQEVRVKIKAKKITHFQLIMENDKLDEGMGLLSVGIKWRTQNEVK